MFSAIFWCCVNLEVDLNTLEIEEFNLDSIMETEHNENINDNTYKLTYICKNLK